MNAPTISTDHVITENAEDSDSDTNSEGIPEYYQPISSFEGEGDINANGSESHLNGYDDHHCAENQQSSVSLSNGHADVASAAEFGMRSLDVREDEEETEEGEEEEEEERRRAESDSAMRRAFEEDESRRNAPLSSENAVRVMEAMRGISFSGFTPDWASEVPEDHWVDQIRRLRQPPSSTA